MQYTLGYFKKDYKFGICQKKLQDQACFKKNYQNEELELAILTAYRKAPALQPVCLTNSRRKENGVTALVDMGIQSGYNQLKFSGRTGVEQSYLFIKHHLLSDDLP